MEFGIECRCSTRMTVCSCCVCGHINIYDCCLNRNALGHYYSSIWNCIGLVFLTFAGYTHRGRRNVMKYFKTQRRDIGFQNKSMLMRSMDTNAYAVPQLFCMVGYWSVLTTSYYASTPHIKTTAQDAYDWSRTAREKTEKPWSHRSRLASLDIYAD